MPAALAPGPIRKTTVMMRLTSMPIRRDVSWSSETARIAVPVRVKFTKAHRPAIIAKDTTSARICMAPMRASPISRMPPASEMASG